MAFIDTIKAKAKQDKKTIILPESMDRRTYEAAAQILEEDFANLIIIGTPEEVAENSKGLDISKATIIDPHTYEKTQEYIDLFVELRKNKGMTPEKAKETIFNAVSYTHLDGIPYRRTFRRTQQASLCIPEICESKRTGR